MNLVRIAARISVHSDSTDVQGGVEPFDAKKLKITSEDPSEDVGEDGESNSRIIRGVYGGESFSFYVDRTGDWEFTDGTENRALADHLLHLVFA